MDRGAWQATVHGVPKILTQLRDWVTLMLSFLGREEEGKACLQQFSFIRRGSGFVFKDRKWQQQQAL